MKKTCIVRFDDVCPTMDREQFNKAFALMDKEGIKPLLGVIPNNQDHSLFKEEVNSKFWEEIKSLQDKGYDIAMHGYSHVYDQFSPKTLICGRKHSEFAGNTYQNQFIKIKKGKEILESHGIYTDVFFAPAHTYDKNTLKALSANGFKYISDGLSNKPYKQNGVICVPCKRFGIPATKNGILVAVCHPNEWSSFNASQGYEKLLQFCEINRNFFTSFSLLKNEKCGHFLYQKFLEKCFYCGRVIKRAMRNILNRR